MIKKTNPPLSALPVHPMTKSIRLRDLRRLTTSTPVASGIQLSR